MKKPSKQFAVCIDIEEYEASLVLWKLYPILRDKKASEVDYFRIVDESGEDYLYHKSHFVFVDFPRGVKKKILSIENET